LAEGGSAADAAIAANAVLGVVEPMMNGIGGDLFVLYWEARTGKLTGLNASGPAPRSLSPEFLAGHGIRAMADAGIHCVTVPGAVDGWAKMHARFGKLPWKNLFRSAIAYSERGFPVSDIVQRLWTAASDAGLLQARPETARVFLPNRRPPQQGEVFRNPDLAGAYRLLAENGVAAFYQGKIAEAILATSKAAGGLMTAGDLAAFSSEWVDPIATDYRGWRVFELPPNGQGMAALESPTCRWPPCFPRIMHASAPG
jgi:gamma-glutamyltranspeptidase/glutathione hydrolase